ncbi:YsnF/AvaK domain-containing protein [Clostridium magnum]|uniref:Stress response protein YsnF n=1 Tax=Clostridium magnum DSM 2767 TaxID=1121326 RepID=A0A162SIV2_9CLOT|nr:YsnF/AvaK domain-containing protein [Clostridium magnum]KZL91331.1 stress response protein YsnF [Clostridium magnum DSM 2767]SHH38211.1 conserved domain-containing protein [Clostridium magnum DSM 2767]
MFKASEFSREKKEIDQDSISQKESRIDNNKDSEKVADDINVTLQLREEQLDIAKKWIKTGDVDIHKEILTEEKNLTVPISKEVLVIEKKCLNKDSDENIEVIRIPVREEQIDISKHWVVLEDVHVYKNRFEENEHIEETLKKEKLHLKTKGNPVIINKEIEKPS